MNILYVCRQNMDRSAIAEWLTAIKAEAAGLSIVVNSAGMAKARNYEISPELLFSANLYLKKRKYPASLIERLKTHRPKQISIDDVAQANLILAMSRTQHSVLEKMFSEDIYLKDKLYTLSEYAQGEYKKVSSPVELSSSSKAMPKRALSLIPDWLPLDVRRYLFPAHPGKINKQDRVGIQQLHDRMIQQIDSYVNAVLEKAA
ncbi:MAG: hypothetical protein ACMXX5_01440 [Candidatus Woesearchaeota archaeon]